MRRAVFTLLAGGVLAQALPLLLGPWLTRLYSPADFGLYHLFAAVAANVGVVACARYEFALPLAAAEPEAAALRALCQRLLLASTALASAGGSVWALVIGQAWPLWLPAAVGALGLVSLATMNATRAQRFRRLAAARVLQHGGGALAQLAAGLLQAGVTGLVVAPIAAALAALAALGWPGPARAARAQWLAVARVHRSFPLLNTPHAFLGALQDTLAVALIAGSMGPAAAGAWGLALRYLKAPATLVGGAVSQALYPRLAPAAGQQAGCTAAGRALVLRTMLLLSMLAAPLVLLLWWLGPALFTWAFGAAWADAGVLARALALYIGLHFVASPLGVVTMAWQAQAWALKLALVGQGVFVTALAAGLAWGGLAGAGWAVSGAMALYFGWYFIRLATWPVNGPPAAAAVARATP
ncbi:MAG: oligosaccharide flippase family protein [Rubrivivax sp.]|nr:oligosaccharide flippase family protein [Rubrivivax sp.]